MGADRLHILTGAPGSGKTAVLEGLGDGVHTVRRARAGGHRRAAGRRRHRHRRPGSGAVRGAAARSDRSTSIATRCARRRLSWLFDRGVPDCVAYAAVLGVDPAGSLAAARRYRYHPEVMILEPWEQIYATDAERTMSFEHTIPFHEALVDAYEGAGYALVRCPPGPSRTGSPSSRDAIRRVTGSGSARSDGVGVAAAQDEPDPLAGSWLVGPTEQRRERRGRAGLRRRCARAPTAAAGHA